MWWLRSVRAAADPAAGDLITVHAIGTAERPDGAVVDVGDLPPGRAASAGRLGRVTVRADTLQLLRVERLRETVDAPASLVLLERVRRDRSPVEAELVAFLHDDVAPRAAAVGVALPAGSVLTAADAGRLGLTASDQVAAARWVAGSGQVLEIYVAPAHRRRGIATFLLLAAEGASAARGWPRLWGGGVRTALGEAMLRRLRWGVGRVHRLTEVAPPMTPASDTQGLDRRLLEPDA